MKKNMSGEKFSHTPVLLQESIDFLNIKPGGTYVDCTLGGGGHTEAMITPSPLGRRGAGVRVICFDLDPEAIAAAKSKLASHKNIIYINDNFSNLKKHLAAPVDGFLFDLGVSSHQIDTAARGFSIREDGPLDMRLGQKQKLSARDIINDFPREELTKIFFQFGEEKFSRRVAKGICSKRENKPIETTFQLKEIIEGAIPTWKKRESVTRIFQALRIAVNQELDSLKTAINDAIELLKPEGRIVALTYHSLEDRIVKHTFREAEDLKVLTKKPHLASEEEIFLNPRARSAKLRAAEKQNAQIT
ncbi:MAG: 16S rRNA (cytosine(1402)-N(4))-methyltransferase RsmH [bacterium]